MEFTISKVTETGTDKLFGDGKKVDYVLVYETTKNTEDSKISNIRIDINGLIEKINQNSISVNEQREIFLSNLYAEGFEMKYYRASSGKTFVTYIFIDSPDAKICEAAEKTSFKVKIADCKFESSKNFKNCFQHIWNILTSRFKLPNGLSDHKQRSYVSVPYTPKLDTIIERYTGNRFPKGMSPKDRSLLTYEYLSRIPFTKFLFENSEEEDVSKIGIERSISDGVFTAAYTIHDTKSSIKGERMVNPESDFQVLWEYWAKPSNMFKFQPLHHIKEYFGEKVAFYFTWLGFYTTWLIVPSIIGVLVFIYGIVMVPFDIPTIEICNNNGISNLTMCKLCKSGTCETWKLSESCLFSKITHIFDNGATVFFSIVMAIWTVLFIEFWKRRQSELQYEWDVVDFDDKYDTSRPEFERKVKNRRINTISQNSEPYIPFKDKVIKYSTSTSFVLLMIGLAIAVLLSVIVYRVSIYILLSKFWGHDNTSFFVTVSAAALNLLIIILVDKVYSYFAILLTDLELQRTDSSYEKSFTVKMYVFQFVNFYSSIFYIAFFKERFHSCKDLTEERLFYEPCDTSGCFVELSIQLIVIIVGKQFIGNIQEFFYPAICNFIRKKTIFKKTQTKMLQFEEDYILMDWDNTSLFYEYLEIVIQFGFIALFVVAFPLAPLFAFINNIIEIRVDSYKFLRQTKRPLAKKAQSIGIWLSILTTVSRIGVITNCSIIAFTSSFIPKLVYMVSNGKNNLSGYTNYTLIENNSSSGEHCMCKGFKPHDEYTILMVRLAFIVCFEHFTFFLVACIHWIIPDVPKIIKQKIENENTVFQRIKWEKNEFEYKSLLLSRLNSQNLDI